MEMPFSIIKKVSRNSPSIRAHITVNRMKRAASFCLPAGVTLEACMAMTAFMLIMVPFISMISYVDMQSNMQMNLENTARDIAQKSYYTQGIMSMDIVSEKLDALSEKLSDITGIDEKDKEKVKEVSFVTVVAAMMTKECGLSNINSSYIVGGIAGISYDGSSYDSESGSITLNAGYCVRLPMTGFFDVFENNCRVVTRAWTGRDISKKEEKVYITKKGTVYHKSLECKYLDIGIKCYDANNVESLRNKSGARYKMCEYCDETENTGVVYVTDYGRRYHNRKDCSRLLRNIITIEKSQVGDMPPCSACGGETDDD